MGVRGSPLEHDRARKGGCGGQGGLQQLTAAWAPGVWPGAADDSVLLAPGTQQATGENRALSLRALVGFRRVFLDGHATVTSARRR